MDRSFAKVALPLPMEKEFTYSVPERLRGQAELGSRVLVPFGRRQLTGIIVDFAAESGLSGVREIIDVLDPYPAVTPEILSLTRWVSDYYICPWGEVLKSALPAGMSIASRAKVSLRVSPDGARGLMGDVFRGGPEAGVIELLLARGESSLRLIKRELGETAYAAVSRLRSKGIVDVRQELPRPGSRAKSERIACLKLGGEETRRWIDSLKVKAPAQSRCLEVLLSVGGTMGTARLSSQFGIGPGVLKALEAKGLLEFRYEEVVRDPYGDVEPEEPMPFELTPAQKEAVAAIRGAMDSGKFTVFLLKGVTGSGKTQVYIESISHALRGGKSALVLVPEISLTPQTVRRFKGHFAGEIAVLHSRLSAGERYDAWRGVREGKYSVVVGARSAVFAPLRNLGLIVVDEEQESSYKQSDTDPRYNARDVAVVRAKLEGATVVLGSATPSLESFYNARMGKYRLLTLPERIDGRPLPRVEVVDMKGELKSGNRSIFSRALRAGIADRLRRGEQVILLQNRRGYSKFIQCRDCGFVMRCRDCDVALTYHSVNRMMVCHYCGLSRKAPSTCPECGGSNLRLGGVGTQRVEESLRAEFPNVRIIRMDLDTTGGKGAHYRLLESFRKGRADILLGTQMVAKGLDFPEVTLVGVISADTALNLPDFRASEKTFQLLTQVAGRTGRGEIPGEVIVQSYVPGDEAISYAKFHDFDGFAERELSARSELGYPPFGRLVEILFRGTDRDAVSSVAERYSKELSRCGDGSFKVMGAVEAPIPKIRGEHRWQVLLKGRSPSAMRGALRRAGRSCGPLARRMKVKVDIDVDPIGML